uniref:Uncharacterized protein n=1 Tax=Gopherus agassizii TaxID=38772 RepID=A0A452H1I1_9SAUR
MGGVAGMGAMTYLSPPQQAGSPPAPSRATPGPGPIGTDRSQRAERVRESGGGPKPSPESATPSTGPPIQFGASDKPAGASREWELHPAPQPRALGPACPPAEPLAFSGERGLSQRPYPELFFGSQPGVAQVPCPPVESQLNGSSSSFRPGTPSLHLYRSQHLYLQPGPAPSSPAAPVLPGSALLSGVALKGQYVEFSALQAAELAKLPATGLLYQAAPPFLYSPPFCAGQLGPEQPLLQVRQELNPPSDFYPGSLAQANQSNFLQAPGPTQQVSPALSLLAPPPAPPHVLTPLPLQMLLPVVESQLPPVVNFSSLQQGAPAAPPPLPLVPVTPALRPPGQLAGRLVPSPVRAFPHGMGRTELHPVELKPFPEYRKLSSLGGRAPSVGRACVGPFSSRLPAPGSSYAGGSRSQRPDGGPPVSLGPLPMGGCCPDPAPWPLPSGGHCPDAAPRPLPARGPFPAGGCCPDPAPWPLPSGGHCPDAAPRSLPARGPFPAG